MNDKIKRKEKQHKSAKMQLQSHTDAHASTDEKAGVKNNQFESRIQTKLNSISFNSFSIVSDKVKELQLLQTLENTAGKRDRYD